MTTKPESELDRADLQCIIDTLRRQLARADGAVATAARKGFVAGADWQHRWGRVGLSMGAAERGEKLADATERYLATSPWFPPGPSPTADADPEAA